ncbi:very short patch repair endonuclease [Rhizobium sp. NLR4a]|uniref:very short patch repair endonuclease n=1 Tax=Rhizobium sp. NLR4a TaxID=2731117 RepID=UPI001C838796|nr:DNA mismatch endonuclease Vsr [Rhizobium sp. NLR4a]
MDRLTSEHRSWLMSRVRGKNTTPEMRVRKVAHSLGFRYRLHRKDLPGKPDLCFPKRKVAIFVHGCFWHRHEGCRKASLPKSRTEYWYQKFASNVERDERSEASLVALGWKVHVIWECQTKNEAELRERLYRLLT